MYCRFQHTGFFLEKKTVFSLKGSSAEFVFDFMCFTSWKPFIQLKTNNKEFPYDFLFTPNKKKSQHLLPSLKLTFCTCKVNGVKRGAMPVSFREFNRFLNF